MGLVIGINIGGTNFCPGCTVKDGVLSHFEKKPSASMPKEGAVEILCREIRDYTEQYSLAGRADAVFVGVLSTVSKDKDSVYSTSSLEGLENVDLDHLLEKSLGIRVFVNRDVNYLLRHDIKKYNLDPEGDKIIPGIHLDTGFSNATYVNRRFHAGKNGVSEELGHVPLFHLRETCPCGNEGRTELRCSGAHPQRTHDQYYPETKIGDISTKYGNEPAIHEYVEYLAYPISTEVATLDPDCVVMRGGIMTMKDLPMENLIRQVKKRMHHPHPSKDLGLTFPEHMQASGAAGGGLAAPGAMRRQ